MPTDDYIKRSDALKAARYYKNRREENHVPSTDDVHLTEYRLLAQAINSIPAADVEPKRKTGFWTDSEVWIDYENNARETVRCSLCNNAVDVHCANNYCTYCGARMLPEPPNETDGDEQTTEDI